MHHSISKILFVLGANEYLERLEGNIRKCLFFYVKFVLNNSVGCYSFSSDQTFSADAKGGSISECLFTSAQISKSGCQITTLSAFQFPLRDHSLMMSDFRGGRGV